MKLNDIIETSPIEDDEFSDYEVTIQANGEHYSISEVEYVYSNCDERKVVLHIVF